MGPLAAEESLNTEGTEVKGTAKTSHLHRGRFTLAPHIPLLLTLTVLRPEGFVLPPERLKTSQNRYLDILLLPEGFACPTGKFPSL